jgi:hypothetical protein
VKSRRNELAQTRLRRIRRAGFAFALVVCAIASGGCTREFYREWADQDVTQSIFQMSRDPRWRLDMFSIEPPAMSRFADPFDPDRLPSPPDDHPTEALTVTPQWPNNRVLTPVEGTGYIDMLENWMRERPQTPPRPAARPSAAPAATGSQPTTPPPSTITPSPFQPGANSGPKRNATSPILSRDTNVTSPALMPNPGPGIVPPQARTTPLPRPTKSKEPPDVLLVNFQAPDDSAKPPQAPPGGDERSVPIPTGPQILQVPANVDPETGLRPEQYRAVGAEEMGAVGALTIDATAFDEAEAAGLPPGSRVYIVNPAQTLTLALINSRHYQFHLEELYRLALPVALNRFKFVPQFELASFPGAGAVLPAAGGLPSSFPNQFNYSTRDFPGGQKSALNLGTVAGVGKVFASGGTLVTGFANQLVFNFLGKHPLQPTSNGFLPLSFVQPFLKGGGRAVTLEPLANAERTLLYEVRNFALYRQQFIPFVFGVTQPLINEGVNDPNIGYLNVLQQLQDIENDQQTLASFQRYLTLYKGSLGGGSGISQLQVDQMDQQVQNTLQTIITDTLQYRTALDQFKFSIGLPPDLPLVLDRSLLNPIRRVFFRIEAWSKLGDNQRDNEDLKGFIDELPKLTDVIVDGRPVVAYFADAKLREDVLLAGERVALENRYDLMNARAQLYDAWRQLAVTANALMGTFNLTMQNTFQTPSTTVNPFAFIDNSKNFQLTLNMELPLVRMTERNNYRQAIINYRRQQRILMGAEDALKYAIRNDIRQLVVQAESWEIQKRLLFLTLRQRDNSQRQINAPPQGAGVDTAALVNTNTNNLTSAQNALLGAQTRLIGFWVQYVTFRMALIRDLGIMPYDEWEAFYEFFPPDTPSNRPNRVANARPAAARPAVARVAASEGRR